MKPIRLLLICLFAAQNLLAQANKTITPVDSTQNNSADTGFTTLPSGLEFKVVKHGSGTRMPVVGDHIEMFIKVHVKDSIMFESRKMYGPMPVPYQIVAPKFKGDPVEGFMMMVAGDSAVFKLPVDSMQKAGNQMLPWMKPGQKVEYNVVLTDVRSDEEDKKKNEEHAAAQKAIDDKILEDYFKKNGIDYRKTASGLYYTITKKGKGKQIDTGKTVSVNYKGMFMDGKVFDTNMDSSFHHKEPYTLEIGKGHVIKGWDEGITLLKKKSHATLYIPSGMAYGAIERNGIPANSILIFDVVIADVADSGAVQKKEQQSSLKQLRHDDKMLKKYFKKNGLHPAKTASGLYYVITKEGKGENAKSGDKAYVNYVGKLLDGAIFDKNIDTGFAKPIRPFSFTVGLHNVIEGWDEGIRLLNQGSRATFYIPSSLAYGEKEIGKTIPPHSILIFEIALTKIEP